MCVRSLGVGWVGLMLASMAACAPPPPDDDIADVEGRIAGTAVKGPIAGATVVVYEEEGGEWRVVAGADNTDDAGDFDVSVGLSRGDLLVSISGGSYIEESTGRRVGLGSRRLEAWALDVDVGEKRDGVQVNPVTTWIAAYSRWRMAALGESLEHAEFQTASVLNGHFGGIDWRTILPRNLTATRDVPFDDRSIAGLVLASLSELVAEKAEAAGQGAEVNSGALVAMIAEDLEADGTLDGLGVNDQPLTMHGANLDVETLRVDLARAMYRFVTSERNGSGLTFEDVQDLILWIAESRADIFPGSGPDPRPLLSIDSPADGESVFGEVTIQASAQASITEITETTLRVGGVEVEATVEADGVHGVRLEATVDLTDVVGPLEIRLDVETRFERKADQAHEVNVTEAPLGPVVVDLAGPADITNESTATFTFGCSKDGCTFTCRLDGAVQGEVALEEACDSGVTYSGLADDTYTFMVVATAADETGPSLNRTWTLDTVVPIVEDLTGPASLTKETAANFAFACSKPSCIYQCRLQGAQQGLLAYDSGCVPGVQYSSLADDEYTFGVQAVDPAGNVSSLQTWSWVVDTLGPEAQIAEGPNNPTNETTATFVFDCSKDSCTYACRVEGQTGGVIQAFDDCVSGFEHDGLADDAYVFTVIATDVLGNVGSPSEWTWVVDTAQPTLAITDAPPMETNVRWASFAFECAGDKQCEFECALDAQDVEGPFSWEPCESPWIYSDLSAGGYAFRVRATDSAGNDSEIATHVWRIVFEWAAVSAGWTHTCGIGVDGTLWCWGQNGVGQLGDGTIEQRRVPTRVGLQDNWITVSAGAGSTCGVQSTGELYCWGDNLQGQLGTGDNEPSTAPVPISVQPEWQGRLSSSFHVCALRSDGELWCWGHNGHGQLGDGSNESSPDPIHISPASRWLEVVTGYLHTCAIQDDGGSYCWGLNGNGQLGDGSKDTASTPQAVESEAEWSWLATGHYHSCGIQTNGQLWCWGSNGLYQLGDGTTEDSWVPVLVSDAPWSAVDAGPFHSCGIRSDETLWCWGDNRNGQRGSGWDPLPLQVAPDQGWLHVAAGGSGESGEYGHTCAIRDDHSLWCWGSNGKGQLGDGTTENRAAPQQVSDPVDN